MSLEPAAIIADQSVSDGVRFIETHRPIGTQLIPYLTGNRFRNALLNQCRLHRLAVLIEEFDAKRFTHCPSQRVNVTPTKLPDFSADHHHLFLIGYDTQGLLEVRP